MQSSQQPEVRAAGGVVRRNGGVLIVHRPQYDDGSLPKGKLEEGESFEQAALREIQEETGWDCELGRDLGESRYTDQNGRSKVVRWWEMFVIQFRKWEPDDEIDDYLWIPVADPPGLLTYESDREVLERLRALPYVKPPGPRPGLNA